MINKILSTEISQSLRNIVIAGTYEYSLSGDEDTHTYQLQLKHKSSPGDEIPERDVTYHLI